MDSHDSVDAFDALIQREFTSGPDSRKNQPSGAARSRPGYRRRYCDSFRVVDLRGAIDATLRHLQDRKIWNDKDLVFRTSIDGVLRRMCPLVEYRPPRSSADRRLIRKETKTYLSDNGCIIIIDKFGEYVVPTPAYWGEYYDHRRAVWLLLWTVRRNY